MLPEFSMLIKTSFNTIDVHALAPDTSQLRSGAWHATMPMDLALRFKTAGATPKAFQLKENVKTFKVECALPWSPERNESFNVELIHMEQTKSFHIGRRGTNNISIAEFTGSQRYTGEKKNSDCDVTIVTGTFKDDPSTQLLLLMRFHNMDPKTYINDEQVQELYSSVNNNNNNVIK